MSEDLQELANRFSRCRMLVVGDAMLDTYYQGTCQRLSQEAPVPIVEQCDRYDFPGGAANTAINIATLQGQCQLITALGNDFEAQCLKSLLSDGGVDTKGIVRDFRRRTLTKQRVMCGQQMHIRFDHGTTSAVGAQTEDRLISCLEAEFPQCQAVVVTDFAGGTLTPRVIASLVQLQKRHRRILAINARSSSRFRDAGVTVLKASYREAVSQLGLPVLSGAQRIDQLKTHGPRLLEVTSALAAAVTLDNDGTILIDAQGTVRHIPSPPLPETLTSGASDTFLAVLSLGLAAGGTLSDAGQLANAATSVVARSLFKRICRPKELIEAIQPTNSDGEHSAAMQYMNAARKRGQTVVLTTGCFDVLHRGHIAFLRQARRLGNILVVGVRSDESIRKLKGPDRPLNSLDDRIGVLASLDCVDHVVPFEEDSPERLISEICPDIFVKAGDDPRKRVPEAELVERLGGRVVLLPYLAGRSINLKIEQIRNGADVESRVSETDDSDPMMERTFRSTVI